MNTRTTTSESNALKSRVFMLRNYTANLNLVSAVISRYYAENTGQHERCKMPYLLLTFTLCPF